MNYTENDKCIISVPTALTRASHFSLLSNTEFPGRLTSNEATHIILRGKLSVPAGKVFSYRLSYDAKRLLFVCSLMYLFIRN